jgi:glycerophosphoryl diester phosphodiesterase
MLILGHRGASGYAPENTIAAFGLGIRQGCHGFEFDVQLSRDGEPVVHHDWSVERTTGGTGDIRDLTFREIRSLDAGKWFSPEYRGEKIPALAEVLELIPEKMLLNVELKSRASDGPGLEEKTIAVLRKHGRLENTILSSFNHLSLKRARDIAPGIRLGMLYEALLLRPFDYLEKLDLGLYSIHPLHDYVSPDLVLETHRHGIKMACWTVNSTERARELLKDGVDIIITNYPDRCLELE